MTEQSHDFTTGSEYEYMPYVLYIKPGDPNCRTVLARITQMSLDSQVVIHDVTQSKSSWLRGVPTLLTKATKTSGQVVTERAGNIIAKLREIKDSNLDSKAVSNMNTFASPMGGESLYAEGMFSIEGDPTPGPASGPGPGPGRGQNEKAQRRARMEANTNSAVEALQNQRAAMDRQVQGRGGIW